MADDAYAAPEGEQKTKRNAEADKKILDLAKKRFKAAMEAESENRAKELDDLKFLASSPDDNFQWPTNVLEQRTNANQEGGARPCLTINKLPQHQRQVTNEQRMNQAAIKARPVDDRADPETARMIDGVMRAIQAASEASLAFNTAGDYQVGGGEGFFRVLTEYSDERSFDQDIVIKSLPDRFKVYMDPIGLMKHPAGKECQWGFIVEDLPKEEYEEQYGEEEHKIEWADAGIGDMTDWFPSKDTVRIAEYLAIESKPAKLLKFANGATMVEGEDLPEGVTAVEKPVDTRQTRIPQCVWRKITGQHVLAERKMPTKYLPIIRMVGNQWIIEGKPIISGIVRNAKDAQRLYNYNRSMEAELNGLAPKAPFIGYAEQFAGHEDQWRKANQVSYAYLKANMIYDESTGQPIPLPLPQRAQPAMPQAAILAAAANAADDIKATTGQYDPSLGNNPQAKSGVALQREQIKSDVGTFHYIDNYRIALEYAGCIILDMMPRVLGGKRIARILGEDGEPDHVVLDDSIPTASQDVYADGDIEKKKSLGKVFNLKIGKYDIVVTTGPSFTTKRQEASEFFSNAIQSVRDPQLAAVLTYLSLKSNDWAGADEAVDLVKRLPILQGIIPPAEGEGDEPPEIPPEVKQALDQAKQMAGHMKGQLDAATQALAERDKTLQSLEGQVKAKNVEALAKMYEADKRAMSEIEKARAEVTVAHANAVVAAAANPDKGEIAGVVQALGALMTEMQGKIDALAASSSQIAEQLNTFEISARMPSAPPVAAPAAQPGVTA